MDYAYRIIAIPFLTSRAFPEAAKRQNCYLQTEGRFVSLRLTLMIIVGTERENIPQMTDCGPAQQK